MHGPTHRPLVDELATFDRLLEIGVGRRPEIASELVARGRDVVAIDVDETALQAAIDWVDREEREGTVDRVGDGNPDGAGRLRFGRADVVELARVADPLGALSMLGDSNPEVNGEVLDAEDGIDAVYARRLPAELQRPTAELARRLDAVCAFTTLGFETPVVSVDRRSLPDGTLYVVSGASERP